MRPTSRSVEPRICFETSSVAGAVVPLGLLGEPARPSRRWWRSSTGVSVEVGCAGATGETTHRFQMSAVTSRRS